MDAGGRSVAEGWRRMEAPPEGADLVPLDRYDAARAKIAANLQWICAKAYGLGGRPGDDGTEGDGPGSDWGGGWDQRGM
ncbi:unknown_gene_2057 [Phodopus roborovskii]|uniref:Unknown_gene_2057 protein n=1 Tax=Phodopus roborovskii TaxID=109678 RepID=A0AAU9Z7N5_PHORO|nr:unknown_gene_2057 [Phodopus roborovskii]